VARACAALLGLLQRLELVSQKWRLGLRGWCWVLGIECRMSSGIVAHTSSHSEINTDPSTELGAAQEQFELRLGSRLAKRHSIDGRKTQHKSPKQFSSAHSR